VFGPVLKKRGARRLDYSTSVWFRIAFLVPAVAIIAMVANTNDGSLFKRVNLVALIVVGLCLLAALYLERWVFDKDANRLERNIGLVFWYSRRRYPLDALQKVVLEEPGVKYRDRPKLLRRASRRTAMLCIVDRNGSVHGLDIVKGGAIREIRMSAQLLSDFCEVPLEDHLGDIRESR
jgi:hypothetical protein